jgi:hypothetical protein
MGLERSQSQLQKSSAWNSKPKATSRMLERPIFEDEVL